jgi:hypothetical protein
VQPSSDPTDDNIVDDSNVIDVLPSTTTKSVEPTQTSQKALNVSVAEEDEFDPEDLIDDPDAPTSVPQVITQYNVERSDARKFMQTLVRAKELDEEAAMPSGDEHLLKQTQAPLLAQIKRLNQDNIDLQNELEDADCTTEMTPKMIRDAIRDNTRLILDIRKELNSRVEPSGPSGGITIDVGSIFNEALNRAREHSEA